ncbi:unnamed protein product [Brassica oleracea var. botrytis]
MLRKIEIQTPNPKIWNFDVTSHIFHLKETLKFHVLHACSDSI